MSSPEISNHIQVGDVSNSGNSNHVQQTENFEPKKNAGVSIQTWKIYTSMGAGSLCGAAVIAIATGAVLVSNPVGWIVIGVAALVLAGLMIHAHKTDQKNQIKQILLAFGAGFALGMAMSGLVCAMALGEVPGVIGKKAIIVGMSSFGASFTVPLALTGLWKVTDIMNSDKTKAVRQQQAKDYKKIIILNCLDRSEIKNESGSNNNSNEAYSKKVEDFLEKQDKIISGRKGAAAYEKTVGIISKKLNKIISGEISAVADKNTVKKFLEELEKISSGKINESIPILQESLEIENSKIEKLYEQAKQDWKGQKYVDAAQKCLLILLLNPKLINVLELLDNSAKKISGEGEANLDNKIVQKLLDNSAKKISGEGEANLDNKIVQELLDNSTKKISGEGEAN